jgi:hypothetical protein
MRSAPLPAEPKDLVSQKNEQLDPNVMTRASAKNCLPCFLEGSTASAHGGPAAAFKSVHCSANLGTYKVKHHVAAPILLDHALEIINHQADLKKLLSCWASKYSPFAANKKPTCQPTNQKTQWDEWDDLPQQTNWNVRGTNIAGISRPEAGSWWVSKK